MKTALRILLVAIAVGVLTGAGIYHYREDIGRWWMERELASRLSDALQAVVDIGGLEWKEGILRASWLRMESDSLPFEKLEVKNWSTPLDWNRIKDPFGQPLVVEATSADMIWKSPESAIVIDSTKSNKGNDEKFKAPALDFTIAHFSIRQPNHDGWSLRDTALRAKHEKAWAFSARNGTLAFPGLPPLQLEKLSAKQHGSEWVIESFAVNDGKGGKVSGSARHDGTAWSGAFTWENVGTENFLAESSTKHFVGKSTGTATLDKGVLRGHMTLVGAETKSVPTLVKMASLFVGENWDSLPWESFEFEFTRETDGVITFRNLSAFSSKGLTVSGSGRIAPDSLAADLELGVRREGRPWLVAFMPTLFRSERGGYFWVPVHVGGTMASPSEDLTARVVTALAVVPAAEAVKSATDIPGKAVEAAGSLLDVLMGR